MKKILQALLIALGATALAIALLKSGALDRLEYATWSWRAKLMAKPSPSTDKIKIILIDQASLDWGAKENSLSWPWPRSVYAPVLDFCKRSGARVVAFDMLYSEPGVGVADDAIFGDAIQRNGKYIGAFFMGSQASEAGTWPAHAALPPKIAGLDTWLTPDRRAALTEPRATFPIPDVTTNAAMLASVKETVDSDGVFRRISPFRLLGDRTVPQLGIAAYLLGGDGQAAKAVEYREHRLVIGAKSYPADGLGRLLLRFRGNSGTHRAFSAAAIIQSELRIEGGETPTIDTNALRDCYVFFGVSAPGLKDLKSTPVAGDYPGVEIHATVLDNLLENDFLRDAPGWMVLGGTLVPAVLAALLVLFARKVWQTVAVIAVFALLPIARGFVAYALGFWWPVVGPELAVALSLLSAVVLNYATEGKQKRFIKSAFGQYLSGDVIEDMLRNPNALKLGGEKKELSLFFSDIEKFSSFSELLEPQELTSLLNDFLTEMSDTIMDEGGTVDKYVGDAIVAFWNAPVDQADHAVRACRAAIRCQRRLDERREEWATKYGAIVKMRIGLNTGDVVVGNLGSNRRFAYTVLGDAANLASRLEGANKAFGTYIMVAEATWQRAKEGVTGRELGSLRVVGRKTPVRVYELTGLAGEPVPDFIKNFEGGMAACREGKWEQAAELFESIPDDKAAKLYAEKCRSLAGQPADAWDGVWSLTEK